MPDSTPRPDCTAQVDEPPHYLHTHTCSRRSVTDRHGTPLCTQHARMVDKYPFLLVTWAREARGSR